MTFRSSIRFTITAAALAAVLVIAPAASASSTITSGVPSVPDRTDGLGSSRGPSITSSVPSVPDRTDRLGTSLSPSITSSVPSVPDRTDGLGTSRGPQVVQLPMAAESNGGISWTDGIIAAALLLGASLLAAFAVMSVRGRGRGGLAMPS